MKYSDKYPNAQKDEEVEDSIVKVATENKCWNCSELTNFVEINFMAYLCSDECNAAKWNEFEKASRSNHGLQSAGNG